MSVTSLTGTTWVINVTPVYSPFTKQVISSLKQTNIRASITAGGATYDYISVLVNSNKLSISYGVNGGNSTTVYTQDNGWTSDSLRTVAFSSDATVSGNYDATTAETIEWLEANAVQVVPDVVVSLGSSSIASLDNTGSVTLATQNTYLTDDITVEYTKSGGGGIETVSAHFNGVGTCYYTDGNGTVQNSAATTDTVVTALLGSIIMVACELSPAAAVSNCTKITDISMGNRANYKYVTILQATGN